MDKMLFDLRSARSALARRLNEVQAKLKEFKKIAKVDEFTTAAECRSAIKKAADLKKGFKAVGRDFAKVRKEVEPCVALLKKIEDDSDEISNLASELHHELKAELAVLERQEKAKSPKAKKSVAKVSKKAKTKKA